MRASRGGRSARRGGRFSLGALALALLLLQASLSTLVPATARAQSARAEAASEGPGSQRRARVDVLVLEDPETDWGRRVRGQLSDLPARTQIQVLPTLAGAAAEGALAAPPSHALTAWLSTNPDAASSAEEGTFVAIWFAREDRPHTRRVAGPWHALSPGDRSAVLELAALGVRSAVRSLLLDAASASAAPAARAGASARGARAPRLPARATRQRAPEPGRPELAAPASAAAGAAGAVPDGQAPDGSGLDGSRPEGSRPAGSRLDGSTFDGASSAMSDGPAPDLPSVERRVTPSSVRVEPTPERLALALPAPLGFGLELGAAFQFYGRAAAGDPGLRAGLSLLGRAWSLEVIGHRGWPVSARLGPAAFELQRHALLVELGVALAELGAWQFGPLARAGLTWLHRSDTRVDAASVSVEASQAAGYRSPFLGLGAMVEPRLSEALSLSMRAVLNLETAIPTFTLLDASGALVSSDAPWTLQPSLELGARWRW